MRILVVTHGFPPSAAGGAELYAEAVASRLADGGDEVTVLARENDPTAPEFRVRDQARGPLRIRWLNNTFRTTTSFTQTYRHEVIDTLAARVIDETAPDVAHVHHLTGLSTTILDELGRRGIAVVLTLHDYWLLCHRGQLFDETMTACDGPAAGGCARCTGTISSGAWLGAGFVRSLERRMPGAGSSVRRLAGVAAAWTSHPDAARQASRIRLEHMRDRFAHVTVALAPSHHVRDRFVEAGFPAAVIRVSEYGVVPPPRRAGSHGSPLRLGYLGALMISKAPHLLAEALGAFSPAEVTADIYGGPAPYHGDTEYSDTIAARLNQPGVTVHGPVAHGDIARVFEAIDVLVFPSVWEETSGIGAREALAAGVPVIASRIGGIPETVRHEVNGLLFAPGDSHDLAHQIRRLLDEPALLDRLRAACVVARTLDDDVAATRRLYEQLVGTPGKSAVASGADAEAERVTAIVLNYGTPAQTALAATLVLRSEAHADLIVVDNGDGEACRRALGDADRHVTIATTGRNLGFSGGCNVGITTALDGGAELVWLINSDVVVPPDCLGRLLSALRSRPRLSIVAPMVRSRSWPDRVLSAGLHYDARTGRMIQRTRLDESRQVVESAAVSGCAMLVRRAVFERIGLLPEEYFFSFEDIAFCQRARLAGFEIGVVTDATVFHEGAGSIGTRTDRLYYASRNHLRLGAETPASSATHRWARQLAIASYNVAHGVGAPGGTLPARLAAVTAGIIDHVRGRYGVR